VNKTKCEESRHFLFFLEGYDQLALFESIVCRGRHSHVNCGINLHCLVVALILCFHWIGGGNHGITRSSLGILRGRTLAREGAILIAPCIVGTKSVFENSNHVVIAISSGWYIQLLTEDGPVRGVTGANGINCDSFWNADCGSVVG
jgi:hypothetical protein